MDQNKLNRQLRVRCFKEEHFLKKKEFKERLFEAMSNSVDDMTYEEKLRFIEKLVVDYQKENDDRREKKNKGQHWDDSELRIILQDAPTIPNCMKYAKIFGRGYGSIEQIYRWAATDMESINEKRPNDAFILQVKRIAKEIGWRA